MSTRSARRGRSKPGGARQGRGAPRYRIWITRYGDWVPRSYCQVPPDAIVLEAAEGETMSARQGARYVAAFNRAALAGHRKLWAVAIPVAGRFEGEPHPGDVLPGR